MVEQAVWRTAGLVAFIGFLCYVNSLDAGFVYDDSRAIVKNDDVLSTSPWSQVFFNDFWGTPLRHSGSHGSYRPICVLSFRLNYLCSGLKPWSYHLVNVLLHCATCILVVMVSSVIFNENITASMAGVLFAVHPVHTEAVTGVVGRADVGSCFFYLAALLLYDKACRKITITYWLWMCLSMSSIAMSMLTKEQGITAIGVCAFYDILVISRLRFQNFATSMKRAKKNGFVQRMYILMVTGIILVSLRMWLMGYKTPSFSEADNPAANNRSFFTRTLTFLLLPAVNFWLLVFPHTLCFDWSMNSITLVEHVADIRNLFSLVFYTSFILLCVLCVKGLKHNEQSELSKTSITNNLTKRTSKMFNLRNRKSAKKFSNGDAMTISNNSHHTVPASDAPKTGVLDNNERTLLSIAFLVLPFIPATNLFFYVGFVVAERVLYIPSVGFCLLVAQAFSVCWKCGWRVVRFVLVFSTCIYLVLMSARTVRRNQDWYNDETLYRSGIPVNPSKALSNLGTILKEQGKLTEAQEAYTTSLTHRNSADTWYNLGLLYQEQQQYNESIQCYQNAIRLRPQFVLPYLNQGVVLDIMGYKEEAIGILTQAAAADGTSLKDPKQHEYGVTAAKFHRGRILAELKRYDEAIDVYHDAVDTRPYHFPSHSLYNLLGEAYFARGDLGKAEEWYKMAVESKPDHVPALLAYARLLSQTGRVQQAETTYYTCLKVEPKNTNIYTHYAKHLSDQGSHVDAARVMGKAAVIAPDDYDVVATAADAYRKVNQLKQAARFYKKVAELRPDLPSAQMNLGAMYHMLGELELAEEYYLKTLDLFPSDQEMQSTQMNLEKLQSMKAQQRRTQNIR